MSTQLVQRSNGPMTIKDLLEQAKPKIAAVIPRHLDPERLMRVALVTISRSPTLAQCTPESLLMAFMQGAELGLSFGTAIGEAYLVPFRNGKTNRYEATFIIGYRGLAALARRSGKVKTIQAHAVRDGDIFEYEYGLSPKLRHVPTGNLAAPITHFWACVTLEDDAAQFLVKPKEWVDGVRARSKAKDSGPWVTDYEPMGCKTVFKALSKWLDLSPEFENAVEHSDDNEFGPPVMDVPALPAPENGGQSKSAALADTVAAKRGRPRKVVEQEQSLQDGAPPQDDEMPPMDDTAAPGGEPDEHEKVVIAFIESRECSREQAVASLDRVSQRWFQKPFAQCQGVTLGNLAKRVGNPSEIPLVTEEQTA